MKKRIKKVIPWSLYLSALSTLIFLSASPDLMGKPLFEKTFRSLDHRIESMVDQIAEPLLPPESIMGVVYNGE